MVASFDKTPSLLDHHKFAFLFLRIFEGDVRIFEVM